MSPRPLSHDQDEPSMMDPRVLDPEQELVRRTGLDDGDVDQVVALLEALRRWREAERRMSEASRRYMKLGETDMRAIRFILAMQNHGRVVTPGAIAEHLGITTASTTKLIDRLVAGDHVLRFPHPSDRRSLAIEVTEDTRKVARQAVGRTHARRFDVAARLSAHEREIVTRFLNDLAATAEGGAGAAAEGTAADAADTADAADPEVRSS